MKKIVSILFLIAVLALVTTTAIGYKGGPNCGNCPKQSAVAEPVVADIPDKYADSYAAIDKKLDAKREELSVAWEKDSTTVGQINKLRGEMLEIKKEYQLLNEKVRQETGVDYAGVYGSGQKGFCKKQGAMGKGCGKKGMQGKNCGMQAGKMNCKAGGDCMGKGNRKGMDPARCGKCPQS